MKYFNEDEYNQLLENGKDCSEDKDPVPLIRLYMHGTGASWLITELDPENPDIAFGLCDLGLGFPEIGYVSLSEIKEAQSLFYHLKRDYDFKGLYPLSVYAQAARAVEYITIDETSLKQAAYKL
jgi:hypothetical protein